MKYIEISKDKPYADIYSYYVYASKTFPEGREQFTLSFDGNEIIMYGGLSTNKSNILWKLDPLNLSWSKENCDFGHSVLLRYGHTSNIIVKIL